MTRSYGVAGGEAPRRAGALPGLSPWVLCVLILAAVLGEEEDVRGGLVRQLRAVDWSAEEITAIERARAALAVNPVDLAQLADPDLAGPQLARLEAAGLSPALFRGRLWNPRAPAVLMAALAPEIELRAGAGEDGGRDGATPAEGEA
ncbi:hypothetical protein Q5424_08340 [Conexibacter sp. JD483]|uniref:hypothetical protein n=1 Tax=unclassified Conexibacter TaxID=2627773 RepID=UPI0027188E69|nr:MULTISPECIES: hypothetical protein [unclassified Conexibacter]MDO8183953.1 hypothetical protein [Conexibacter sp. CPCC 205706]MDO8196945.1 hypothetical protein [Conexibacter sp. CPCC 205762]MDR9369085.1 hypothetical protein [Conexibacter sp. JD483]